MRAMLSPGGDAHLKNKKKKQNRNADLSRLLSPHGSSKPVPVSMALPGSSPAANGVKKKKEKLSGSPSLMKRKRISGDGAVPSKKVKSSMSNGKKLSGPTGDGLKKKAKAVKRADVGSFMELVSRAARSVLPRISHHDNALQWTPSCSPSPPLPPHNLQHSPSRVPIPPLPTLLAPPPQEAARNYCTPQ
eukprot:115860-Rhodomonas_salina.1